MNKISIIKRIDSLLGPPLILLVKQFFSQRNEWPEHINKILVIRPGGIGDAVLLIPSLLALKKKFPHVQIDVLAEKRNSSMFFLCSDIGRVLQYDRPFTILSTIQGTYDVVIDTEQWHRMSAIVARLINSPMSIGFATNERKQLFTHPVNYSHDDYETLSFLNLLKPMISDVPRRLNVPFLTIPPAAIVTAKNLFSPLTKTSFVALFPGGSVIERKWGSARFHELAKLLIDKGYGIIVVGGKKDVQDGNEIIYDLPNSINVCGKLSLPETAAVLQHSTILISGDSGIMHIGFGLGIKIVALFGSGREKKWAPREGNSVVINKNLSCSPCTTFGYTPKCKRDVACMKQITVEEVFAAAMTLLDK